MTEPGHSTYEQLKLLADELTGYTPFMLAAHGAGWWLSSAIFLRGLLALFMVASTAAASLRFARLALPTAGPLVRWLACITTGGFLATTGFFPLSALRWFTPLAGFVACALLVLAAWRVRPERMPLVWVLRRERRALTRVLRLVRRSRYAHVTHAFAAAAALLGLRGLIVPPLGWDHFTYHGPRAAHWLQNRGFDALDGPGPLSLYHYFFSGGEVLEAWAMLPFHSDLLANTGNFAQWLALGLAAWALARELRLREPFAGTAAYVAMFVPTLQMELSAGYVEIPLCAFLLAGMVFALRVLRRRPLHPGPSFVLAAMAVGCAAGVKLPGAPPGLVFLGVATLRLLSLRSAPLKQRLAWSAVGLVGAALPVLPWLLAAFHGTGYPLSPMPVTIAGLKLGELDPALRWYQERPDLKPYHWPAERAAIRALFAGPGSLYPGEALGSLAVLPLAMAPLGTLALVWRRRAGALVALALLLPIAAHFSSNMAVVRLGWSTSMSRFWVLSVGLAGLLSLAWCRPGGALSESYRRVLLVYPALHTLITIHLGWAPWEIVDASVVGGLLAVLITLCVASARLGARWWLPVSLCAVGLFSSVLQLRRDQTRQLAFQNSWALHGSFRHWVGALATLPRNETGWNIAITGGPDQLAHGWFYYGFYGPRLEHRIRYVPSTEDGSIPHFGPFATPARLDPNAWYARLLARKIDYVVNFPPGSSELAWMALQPDRFRAVTREGDMALYQVLPQRPPESPR